MVPDHTPDPHRSTITVRAAVLIGLVTAHSVLAKWLYAHPPTGVTAGESQVGAQLMYDGGDVVDVTMMALLLVGWFTAARPRPVRIVTLRPEHPAVRKGP